MTDKAAFLATSLEGSAANVVGDTDSTKRHSYCSLATALDTGFGTTWQRELSRVKLRSRRRRKGEPLPELTEDVERLSRLTYREVPSSLQDEQVKEQLIDDLTDDDLRIRLMQARPTSLHEALLLAVELKSYNIVMRQSPSIRAVTVTEDSASNEKAPEYKDLKDTLIVMAEMVQKLLLEKSLKDDRLDVRNVAKCWNCGKVGNFRQACRQSPRQTEWASTSSRYPGNKQWEEDTTANVRVVKDTEIEWKSLREQQLADATIAPGRAAKLGGCVRCGTASR